MGTNGIHSYRNTSTKSSHIESNRSRAKARKLVWMSPSINIKAFDPSNGLLQEHNEGRSAIRLRNQVFRIAAKLLKQIVSKHQFVTFSCDFFGFRKDGPIHIIPWQKGKVKERKREKERKEEREREKRRYILVGCFIFLMSEAQHIYIFFQLCLHHLYLLHCMQRSVIISENCNSAIRASKTARYRSQQHSGWTARNISTTIPENW